MPGPRRITKDLFDITLKTEIDNKVNKTDLIDWALITNKPQFADNSWRSPVADIPSLPVSNNIDGDLRLVLSTNEVYVWEESLSKWELIGANDINVEWSHIQNKPVTYPATAHTHTETDITDLSKDWPEITNKPLTFPPDSHTHTKLEITDFAHNHTKLEVTDFAHTHTKVEITDFAHNHTKAEISDFAHNHDDDYYTKLEVNSSLANKSEITHNHDGRYNTKSEITSLLVNKVDNTTVNAHTGDSTIHVTQSDKDKWDNAGDKTYEYEQLLLSTQWTINHNLNKQPSITIIDDLGNNVIGKIEYLDLNNVRITFNEQIVGKAYLN